VSKFKIRLEPGSTPLDPNELAGLIPTYITTQAELNLLERQNILEAQTWALKRKNKEVLEIGLLLKLHKKMFQDVWRWAGKTRTSDKSIGVPW
jgi:fido (protein-threonine AMPylation protein)